MNIDIYTEYSKLSINAKKKQLSFEFHFSKNVMEDQWKILAFW